MQFIFVLIIDLLCLNKYYFQRDYFVQATRFFVAIETKLKTIETINFSTNFTINFNGEHIE